MEMKVSHIPHHLKTFLVFLDRIPEEVVYSANLPKNIETDVPLNNKLIEILRGI